MGSYEGLVSGDNTLAYIVNGDGQSVTIVGYSSLAPAIKIPSEIQGLPVTVIADRAFYDCDSLYTVDNDIVTGYQNGRFGVGDPITREQVCTILYRFMGSPKVENKLLTLSAFPDVQRISPFAVDAMAWAVQNGVMSGMANGKIASVEKASRAQVATIVMRMDRAYMFE